MGSTELRVAAKQARLRLRETLVGQVFGRLTVVAQAESRSARRRWLCSCECGNDATVISHALTSGHTQSCGCIGAEARLLANQTHGQKHTQEYRAWRNMKLRCSTPSAHGYEHYGGRGIKVCAEWASSFEAFISDMGLKPSRLHSIDRIDPDGDYTPENCKWSTKAEQSRNTRNALRFEGKPLAQIAEETGVHYDTLYYRLKKHGTPFKESSHAKFA